MSDLYERALVVANPVRPTAARRLLHDFGRFPIPVETIFTASDPRLTHDRMREAHRDGDIIFGCGGDGTTHVIGNILMHDAELRQSLFVPIRGGNANDVARSLNGRRSATKILKQGRPLSIRPIEVSTQAPAAPRHVRYALGYFSVGSTAGATRALEIAKIPNSPLKPAFVAVTVLRSMVAAPDFTVKPQHGDPQTVNEVLALRGERIAKYGRPHSSQAVPAFGYVQTESHGVPGTVADMLRMQQGLLMGEMLTAAAFTVETLNGEPLPTQIDGETGRVGSGSHFELRLADHAYQTLTTEL